MMKKNEIFAYIAGYLDGDGCFNIRVEKIDNRYKYPCQLIVTSTEKPIMEFFKKHLGGNYHATKNREKRPSEKIQYRYCLIGKKSVDAAKTLFPFLKEKKDQCECFINFYNTKDPLEKRQYVERMKQLKHNSNRVLKKHIEFLKTIKKTVSTSKYDFPYIAGFIDAECSLGIFRYRSKNRDNFLYKTTLSLTNTKIPCFIFFIKRFGGSLCFIKKQGNWNNQIIWRISSNELDYLLLKIFPFIQTKKPVCEILINFGKLTLVNGGARHTEAFRTSYAENLIEREKLFLKSKQLNLRGYKSV